jgi:hypothetical protein
MMKADRQIKKINRYTTIPVLLDMLERKRLVLLDPQKWEDRNDSAIMAEYQKRKKVQKLFALCCSYGDETIHHWRTFADGSSGCCVEFSSSKLIGLLKTVPGVRYGPVAYRKIKELKGAAIPVEDIPFTKRWPYRCEEEFRIIWEGTTTEECFEIEFDLPIINKVTINQRMPETVCSTIRTHLRNAFKQPDKRISRSTLYENQVWIAKFKSA